MTPDKIVRGEPPAPPAWSDKRRQTTVSHVDDPQPDAEADTEAQTDETDETDETAPASEAEHALACVVGDPQPNAEVDMEAQADETDETAPASEAEHPLARDTTSPAINAGPLDQRAWWEDSAPITVAPQTAEAFTPDQGLSTPDQHTSAVPVVDIPPMPTSSDAPTEPLSVLVLQSANQPFSVEDTAVDDQDLDDRDDQDLAVDVRDTHMLDAESAPTLIHQRSVQGLAVTALRDVGRMRQENQDSVFALLTTLPREGLDVPMGLFVVADGMGGHDHGEVASRLAVRTVVYEVISQLMLPALDNAMTEALQPLMIAAVQEANRVIWDHARMVNSDMGTTCTAALLLGHALYIAHVGDSRAYMLEAGGLRCLTDDHSAVGRLIQLGQLDPSAARNHPLRSQLYRTIGQQPQIQVDFIYQPLGDSTHLLFCSDGLWGMVSEDQLQQALEQHRWPHDACAELIALANLAGGEDNISAVVVTLPIAERPSG